MHSSRIRIVRCSSRLLGGVFPGGCLPGGVSAWGGVYVCSEGSLPRGGGVCVPGGGVCPCERNDGQIGVKTLPCRNYIADGKNVPTKHPKCNIVPFS